MAVSKKKKAQGKKLVKEAVKSAGKKGFYATEKALEKNPDIESPEKLAGWLKGQAKAQGVLSSKHPYGKKKRKKNYGGATVSKARSVMA